MKLLAIFLILFSLHTFYAQINPSINVNLQLPAHQDTIENYYPTFSWIANGVDISNPRYKMKIKIVELSTNQTAAQGVVLNTPVLLSGPISQTIYPYPFGAHKFEEGKSYGWSIEVFYENIKIHESEAFKFTFPLLKKELDFALLGSKNTGKVYAALNGNFGFRYDVKLRTGEYACEVIGPDGEKVTCPIENVASEQTSTDKLTFQRVGLNFYKVSLPSNAESGTYQLLVTNPNRKVSKVLFTVN